MFVREERSREIGNVWLLQAAVDAAALVSAYALTLFLRFYSDAGEAAFAAISQLLGVGVRDLDPYELFYVEGAPRILLQLAVPLFLLYALSDLYSGRRFIRPRPTVWLVARSNAIVLSVIYAYFYINRNVFHPRSIFITVLVLNTVLCILHRALLDTLLKRLRKACGLDRHPVVVAGDSPEGVAVESCLDNLRPHGLAVVDRVRRGPAITYGDWLQAIRQSVRRHGAETIVCTQTDLAAGQIMELIGTADDLNVSIKILSRELDVIRNEARVATDVFMGTPLVHFDAHSATDWRHRSRHALSRLTALLALLALSPLMLAIAAAIKLTSRGPVLFQQDRLGLDRRPFRIHKFRTMHSRAEELQAEMEEFNEAPAVLFKIRRDPRVTTIGRFLRRFSLDELPQLLNVVRGEMTIVGPRPLPGRDVEGYYEDWHFGRHAGLPGLTGVWQVSGRSEVDFHRMCILDIYYLHNQSWILDLKVILRSVWVVLFARGAY